MTQQSEAVGAVNTDGQGNDMRSNPEYPVEDRLSNSAVFNAAGYLVSGCWWCPPGVRFVVPLVHCQVCGSGVCGLHVTHNLCPRCSVPKTAGDLRRLWDGEPDPYLEERLLEAREKFERHQRETDDGQLLGLP